jgi:phage-related protein
MRDQAGIMKGSIDTLDTGIISAGGTITTATNQISLKTTAHTRIKSNAILPMKNMAITQAVDTAGIKFKLIADINTALKVIPTESLSN